MDLKLQMITFSFTLFVTLKTSILTQRRHYKKQKKNVVSEDKKRFCFEFHASYISENTQTWNISYLRPRCLWKPDVCVDAPGGRGHLPPVTCQHSQKAHTAHTHPPATHTHPPCLKTEKESFCFFPNILKENQTNL